MHKLHKQNAIEPALHFCVYMYDDDDDVSNTWWFVCKSRTRSMNEIWLLCPFSNAKEVSICNLCDVHRRATTEIIQTYVREY